jgi:hypothetical protein
MMKRYTDEQMAGEVHEAIRGLQIIHLDPTASAIWALSHPQLQLVSLRGVRRVRATPGITAREHHEGWVDDMAELGWRYGPVRDPDLREHPNLVPYGQLRPEEQHKDAAALLLVTWMAGLEWQG